MFPQLITYHDTGKGFNINYSVEQLADMLSDEPTLDYWPSTRQMFIDLACSSEQFYFDSMRVHSDHRTHEVIIRVYSCLGPNSWSGISLDDAFRGMLIPIWARFQ